MESIPSAKSQQLPAGAIPEGRARPANHAADGGLSRTTEFSELREMGGRVIPAAMHMHPSDKPGERTAVRYGRLVWDVDIDEAFFSLRTLKRWR